MEKQSNTLPISRQFRRKNPDGSLTRGYGFWEDMEEPKTWGFIEQLLPGYQWDSGVTLSNDLSCIIEKEDDWDMEKFLGYHSEYEGYSIEQLKEELEKVDAQLYKEAEEYLQEAIQSGEIEVREFPVSIVSARIQGEGNNDRVWLQCADQTTYSFGAELYISSCELQNVKCRWINEGTDEEQFQIFLERENAGAPYWCNAQSIDFE